MVWRSREDKEITKLDQLKRYVDLLPEREEQLRKVIARHPMRISYDYLSLINWDDTDDPIARMAIPSPGELDLAGSYDTSGEQENTKLPGLQHKYPQTALILATDRCAVYCRHCFRKRMVGLKSEEVLQRFSEAVRYIKQHKEINNVLITGGDPFVLSTKIIGKFLEELTAIPHLDFIRFGTRVPVVKPTRIIEDLDLTALLRSYSRMTKRIYVVTQFNHPREIAERSIYAIDRLLSAGVSVNNQAVLLKGVNDEPETLAELLNRLVAIGVSPYYVFQCRPVKHVKHNFQVPLYRGYEIVESAKRRLNGFSKRFKFIMSHQTGKIEIVGIIGDEIYLKYHQARDPQNVGKFFKRKLNRTAGWLDELEPA